MHQQSNNYADKQDGDYLIANNDTGNEIRKEKRMR